MSNEYQEFIDRDHARRESMLDIIKKAYPEVDLEGKHIVSNFLRTKAYLSNKEYIECDNMNAWKSGTAFSWELEFLVKYKDNYEIYTTEYTLYLIEEPIGDRVSVTEYDPITGERRRGKRRYRNTHTSNKGQYVELNGKRHYINLKGGNE